MQKNDKPIHIAASSSGSRAGYSEWLALGAVAAGSVGAIVGIAAIRRRTSTNQTPFVGELEPESITAPHGDKLRGAVI